MLLTKKISGFIDAESLLPQGSRVIVGLSGGADSVALLALLSELGYDCIAVHCHFGLRGEEADRDLLHSKAIAAQLGAKFHSVKFDTLEYARSRNVSLEMACRELRYAEFERLRIEYGAVSIAVGHHREDNIETMLLNLLRGCGLHGVKGMLPKNGYIVRPLLDTSREELLQYLNSKQLPFIVDSSNLQNDFKRNKLRNVIIPEIIECFPDAPKTLSASLRNLRECDALYRKMLPPRSESLEGVSPTLLHEWLEPFGFNSAQCKDLLNAATGAAFQSETHILTILPNSRYELRENQKQINKPKLISKTYRADASFLPRKGHIYFDSKLVAEPADWELRLWHEGDRMIPFGMKRYRMAADVMHDCGISATKRRETWVLTRNGELIWIVGHRASAHFAVTKNTTEITEIYIDHEEF